VALDLFSSSRRSGGEVCAHGYPVKGATMPKRSNKFQKLIAAIHTCIGNGVSVEESAFLVDRETGAQREVDVLLKSQLGDYPVVLSVEVNDCSRRAGSDWVEEMAGKHQALQTNKLVLVSRPGFTKPAMEKAKVRGIEVLTIDQACATDWNLALRLEGGGVFQLYNIRFSCSGHIAGRSDYQPVPLSAKLISPREEHSFVGDIVEFVLADPTTKQAVLAHFDSTQERDYYAVFTPPEGTVLEEARKIQRSLIKLLIAFHLDFEATPVEFASGRFRNRPITYAQAKDPDNYLCIVMTRKEDGQIQGTLYDSKGFRRLFLDTEPPLK
jgi:hypothetical protein